MKIYELFKRGGLSGSVAALVLCFGLPQAVQAQSVTIQGGSSGCTWTNYTVDSNRNHTFNCGASTPQPGTIQFSQNTYTVNTGGNLNVTVTRVGGTVGILGGTVNITSGGCTGGGAVTFADGSSTSQTVAITAPGAAGSCPITLTPNSGTNTGTPAGSTVMVVDPTTPGTVGFASGAITITEGGSAVSIGLQRAGGGSQAPAVDVSITLAGTAVAGTHFNVAGLIAPGATIPTGGTCPNSAGVLGCASIGLGAAAPATAVTVSGLANSAATPTLQFVMANITGGSPVGSGTNTVDVTIAEGTTVPANCTVVDAHEQLGGIPPITPTSLNATQNVAFRIRHDLLDNRMVGAFQPAYGMSVSVSNQPCDFGPGVRTQQGCHINTFGLNNTQIQMRVGSANGQFMCAKPTQTPSGHLYVNFSWAVYSTYSTGTPITNYCSAQGNSSCIFQFRRDS
jgi:hypothetical protein